MYVTREAKANSPPAYAVLIAALLAILSLSAAAVTARAQEFDGTADDDGAAIESNYYTDEADAGFFDFGDRSTRADDAMLESDDDWFDVDAEFGQDYDEQLVSDEAEYGYQQDAGVFETDEEWFEDWIGDGE